jgi:transposase
MARRTECTSLEERIAIAEQAAAGQTDQQIANERGLSVWTVRKWRRKAQKEGRSGLTPRRGRPSTGALGSFSPIRQTLRQMREEHPGWGPVTLRLELEKQGWTGASLPSRSRIAAFLRQEGLVRPYQRRSPLPQPDPSPVRQAHEEWAVDAQGVVQTPLGPVSVINIVDEASHLLVESLARPGTSHPTQADYQLALRRGFLQRGLPQRVSLDHDTVFYDNGSSSPFPTPIHLWLVALGVGVRFIQHPPPQEHSRIERTHRTVHWQGVEGQNPANEMALQRGLDERREFLNGRYPSSSLGGRPPLVAFPEARHSGRPYRLEWEEELLDMQRVADYLANGRWYRRVSSQGQVAVGGHLYYLGKDYARQEVETTFDPQTWELVFRPKGPLPPVRRPIQGMTKADLMGEAAPLVSGPYQLSFPLTISAWREWVLAEAWRGTIF